MRRRKDDGGPTALGDDPFVGMDTGEWAEKTEEPEAAAVEPDAATASPPEAEEPAEQQTEPALTVRPSGETPGRLTLEQLVAEAKLAAERRASRQEAGPSSALEEEPEEALLFSWLVAQAPRVPPSSEEEPPRREGPKQILSRLDAWLDTES